ncbi:MAG: PaaI family thioesterase, partial [Oceanobacter sp.]
GPQNPHGLKMTFATDGERIRFKVTIPEHVHGWSHLSHGGITTTILDESMAWACIYFRHQWPLTRNISVQFKKPVFVGQSLTGYSWVGEEPKERHLMLHAELFNEQGDLVAASEGDFAPFETEDFARLNLVEKSMLRTLETMFSSEQPYQQNNPSPCSSDGD